MFQPDSRFETPDDSTTIWRYMDYWKFEDLINSKSLFFRRIDLFPDPFEASIPFQSTCSQLRSIKVGGQSMGGERGFALRHFANCWSIDECESDALWKLYIKYNVGIVIQSDVGSIIKSFKNTSNIIRIGKMEYIDYNAPCKESDLLKLLFRKRKEFKYENELRLIALLKHQNINLDGVTYYQEELDGEDIVKCDQGIQGIKVDVNANELIHCIYLPPNSTAELLGNCHILLEREKLLDRLKPSNIGIDPWY